jgi:hypothetical protein
MLFVWLGMIYPTVVFWKESILWIAIMSVWANVAGEFASYQGARAEKKQDENGNGSSTSTDKDVNEKLYKAIMGI